MHDSGVNSMLLINQLEWQGGDGNAQSWDIKGWVGGDIDRLWLRSEGERSAGRTESAEAQALVGACHQSVVGRGRRRAPGLQTR